MNEISAQNNRRLLEVIELLDSKYVEEMFDDLKVPRREDSRITRRPPVKHWKYLASLAACIVLFALAIPVFSYVAELIADFAAGAGSSSESTSESLTESETTNGMYDEYILTEEDLAELNEAYFKQNYLQSDLYTEEQLEQIKNSKYGKFAETVEAAMRRDTYENSHFYFGKFGDSIVIAVSGAISFGQRFDLGGYRFLFWNSTVYVCHDSTFYYPHQAYEKGFLTDADVEILYDMYIEYFARIPDELKIAPQTENQGMVPLSYNEAREIVWEYMRYDEDPNKLDYIYNVKCYGRFDDAYAVMIGSNAMTFKEEERVETVGGIDFIFETDQKLYIYYWGRFESITEAFNLGWIDTDDLAELKNCLN